MIITLGTWLFQQGGALGYALKDQPKLVWKLGGGDPTLFPSPEDALQHLREIAEKLLPLANYSDTAGEQMTFTNLFTMPMLRQYGLDFGNLMAPQARKLLDQKMSAETVALVGAASFLEGAAFGACFPDHFREYWQGTYSRIPDQEWQNARAAGLVLSETQEERPLEGAILELVVGAIEWADSVGFQLDNDEREYLNMLARQDRLDGLRAEVDRGQVAPDHEMTIDRELEQEKQSADYLNARMKCLTCGNDCKVDATFCTRCGSSLSTPNTTMGSPSFDGVWLATARKQSASIRTVTDVLVRCSRVVAEDTIHGWRLEAELMSNLEIYRRQYKTTESEFKRIGSPRSSNELNQIKQTMDSFFASCDFAFYWGKIHYADASGAPGLRASNETGFFKRMAVKRVTNSGTKFCDNAVRAAMVAESALARLE